DKPQAPPDDSAVSNRRVGWLRGDRPPPPGIAIERRGLAVQARAFPPSFSKRSARSGVGTSAPSGPRPRPVRWLCCPRRHFLKIGCNIRAPAGLIPVEGMGPARQSPTAAPGQREPDKGASLANTGISPVSRESLDTWVRASPEKLIRAARQVHALPVDRCYLVETHY